MKLKVVCGVLEIMECPRVEMKGVWMDDTERGKCSKTLCYFQGVKKNSN